MPRLIGESCCERPRTRTVRYTTTLDTDEGATPHKSNAPGRDNVALRWTGLTPSVRPAAELHRHPPRGDRAGQRVQSMADPGSAPVPEP